MQLVTAQAPRHQPDQKRSKTAPRSVDSVIISLKADAVNNKMNEYTNNTNNGITSPEDNAGVLVIKSNNMVEIPITTTPYNRQARADKLEEIAQYFEDNADAFNMAVEELDDFNGALGSERVYPMWELCDHFGNMTLREFLNKTRDNFDLSASYFKYADDGKVETCEEPEYLDSFYDMGYAVEELHDNAQHLTNTLREFPDLAQLFEELDDIENGEIDE